jgi:hypothetical protein
MRYWTAALLGVGCTASAPPSAVSFVLASDKLVEGEETEATLTVSDPQGVEDIVGGTIVEGRTDLPLVELTGAPSATGEYTATISWDGLAALAPLDFDGSEERTLEATFTDADGGVSAIITAVLTLRCPNGGFALGDKCFHVATTSGPAGQACDTVCTDAGFGCATRAAVDTFGVVGTINADLLINDVPTPTELTVDACDALGSEVEFDAGGQTYTIDPSATVDWTCNCRPS